MLCDPVSTTGAAVGTTGRFQAAGMPRALQVSEMAPVGSLNVAHNHPTCSQPPVSSWATLTHNPYTAKGWHVLRPISRKG